MFIAHMPAVYLLLRGLEKHKQVKIKRSIFLFALVGSVLPDLDMLYFYWIDNRQHLHHSYLSHTPMIYLIAMALLYKLAFIRPYAGAIVAASCVHFVLDSVTGTGIRWLWPSPQYFSLFSVESRFQFWIYNYLFHWTFLFELAIVLPCTKKLYIEHRCSHKNNMT